jgi:uncharacterized protein YoxC
MAKRAARAAPSPALPGLTLHSASTRADALLRQRERLLRDVNRKKQQLEQARAAAEHAQDERARKMEPLITRHDALMADLGALFDELLAEGRLAGRARKAVERIRLNLALQGILPFAKDPEDADQEPEDFDEDDSEPLFFDEYDDREAFRGGGAEHRSGPRDMPSARQPGAESRTLRELFRSLVRAVHPDHAREESERMRRTEVMKQVTRAFEQGDLARLIELERAWQSERALDGECNAERRARELERINAELAAQVKQLASALRTAKRELKGSAEQLDGLFEQASSELDGINAICEFVKRFRDGKISLAEFTHGPHHSEFERDTLRPKRRRRS